MHLSGNFGHIVILFLASLGLIGVLIWSGWKNDALALALIRFGGECGCDPVSQLATESRGGISSLGIESTGGHASFSAAVYGSLAILVATESPGGQRLAI